MKARELVRNMLFFGAQPEVTDNKNCNKNDNGSNSSSLDDNSLCSTLTVDVTQKSLLSPPLKHKTKKSVRFSPHATLIQAAHPVEMTQQEVDDRWYAASDYAYFKQSTSALAKELARSCPQESAILLDVYSQCTRQMPDTDTLSPVLTKQVSHQLQVVYKQSATHVLTGVERPMARTVHRDKYARRLSLVHLIYDVQDYCVDLGLANNDEELRQQCRQISRPSRLFAHQLALAQWQANCADRD